MSECACVYVGYEGEIATFHDSRMVKTRTTHKCTECRREIQPGETYERVRAKWAGGSIETFKTCADCLSIRDSFYCEGYHYGCVLEYLDTHIREMDGEIASSCITPLTERAKDRVCAMIQEVFDERNAIEEDR